jgi:hypothetical protein
MALTKQISNRAIILSPTTAEVTTAQTIAPYYDFRVDGVLDLDLEESLDASRYIDASQSFVSAKVSVRVGGSSEYDIVVKSYDAAGGDEITHINVTNQTFATDNSITTLGFVQPNISAERTLVMTVRESVSATPVEDFCLTIVSSTFADLDLLNIGGGGGGGGGASLTGPALVNTQAFTIDANKALAITSSGVDYASADDLASAKTCIGISTTSSAPAEAIELVGAGLAVNVLAGLGFAAGDEVYLGVNGALVDSATAGAFPPGDVIKQVGFAVNSSDLWVQISDAEIIV